MTDQPLKISEKEIKKLQEIKKIERAKLATANRERYKKLNFPMTCPYCQKTSNINRIKLHMKTKKCKDMKELKIATKPDVEYLFLSKLNRIMDHIQKSDTHDDNFFNELESILNAT